MVDIPTVVSMKARFPQFVKFDDATVQFALDEAVVACGTSAGATQSDWLDNNNLILGIQYYAAHLLQLTLMRASSSTGAMKQSESVPEMSISWSTPPWPQPDQVSDFNLTMYGMRFKELMRKNFPGVLVANSGVRM